MLYTTLNSGVKLPLVGLGTWRLTGYDTIYSTIDAALKHGYRYIDSASLYGNEADIQKALLGEGGLLQKHNLTRDDVFIASKLSTRDMEKVDEAIKCSVSNFGGRVDLFLINFPGNYSWKPNDPRHKVVRRDAWLRLESAKQSGVLRNIGVSNYMQKHLEDLLTYCSVKPAVNQCERHPMLAQNELIKYCEAAGIHFQAYSSLGSSPGDAKNPLMSSKVVEQIAVKHGVSKSQVLLRYSVQQGVSVLPKSTNEAHIATNIDLFGFELDSKDIDDLNALNKNRHFCWISDSFV